MRKIKKISDNLQTDYLKVVQTKSIGQSLEELFTCLLFKKIQIYISLGHGKPFQNCQVFVVLMDVHGLQ